MRSLLRIATRQSAPALWQAEYVKAELQRHHPQLHRAGSHDQPGRCAVGSPLAKWAARLVRKELEQALLDNSADIAVHSMKDAHGIPPGLGLAVICEREDPAMRLFPNQYGCLADLPAGSIVAPPACAAKANCWPPAPTLTWPFCAAM